jgi:hypothetical protein
MNAYVEVVTKRELAAKIHYWAQDILRQNATCGLGKTPSGRFQVIWPGLIDQWLNNPEDHGAFLGTLSRTSGIEDIEKLLEGVET